MGHGGANGGIEHKYIRSFIVLRIRNWEGVSGIRRAYPELGGRIRNWEGVSGIRRAYPEL